MWQLSVYLSLITFVASQATEGVYVVSTRDGKVLTAKGSEPGTEVHLADKQAEGSLNQMWSYQQNGCLKNLLSNLCVEMAEEGGLLMKKESQNAKQKWRYEERQFVSNLNGHVLGVFDAGSMMKHGHKDESSVLGQSWLLRSDGRVIAKNMLEKMSLSEYPLARTTDNSTAVYYKQTEAAGSNRILIYLEGGGFCVPRIPGFECESRCRDDPLLCTAWTKPFHDTATTGFADNIWSEDPEVNPAFHNYFKIFLPYSSSDVHAGTRSASLLTNNYTFHGKYIFKAFVEDIIKNTWITSAEQVILMGGSAGAIGTEANCDFFAEQLHSINPGQDVRCISDSGSLYPYDTHTKYCDPELLEYFAFEVWNAESDESCEEENPGGLPCISFGSGYVYADTPILILMSSEDTTIRTCYSNDQDFWLQWRTELEEMSRTILAERPDIGLYIANCPFHVSSTFAPAWDKMQVPVYGSPTEKIILKDVLYNFVNGAGPYQAIDNMLEYNKECPQ